MPKIAGFIPEDETLQQAIDRECARINAQSAAADASDFAYDFDDMGCVDALGFGTAGVRYMQMGDINLKDWQGQHGRALAYIEQGEPTKFVYLIVSDNATVLCPAQDYLDVFEAGAQRREDNASWRVQRKTYVRSLTNVEDIEASRDITDAGWSG